MAQQFILKKSMIVLLFFWAGITMAHDRYQPTIINNYDSEGTALAIAKAQHNFDWSTGKWQGSVGLGSFDNTDAISFGMGKRVGQTLLNGSIGRENGKYGYGIGVNWRF